MPEENRPIFTRKVTRRAGLTALVATTALVAATLAAAPLAPRNIGVIQPFLPMYTMAIFLLEGLTSFFFALQYRSSREPYLGCLSGAYGFVTIMVLLQLTVFPGVFSPTGLFHASPQASIWIWAFWHGGLPALILLAMCLRNPGLSRHVNTRKTGLAVIFFGPAAGLGLAWLAIAHGNVLPHLVEGNSYAKLVNSPVSLIIIALDVAALAGCIRITRLGDLLSLWLTVALLTTLADAVLVMLATQRYSVGWYSGRILDVISSLVVLGALLYEISKLYDELRIASHRLYERSIRDPLTNAFNRGYLIEQLKREYLQALRDLKPLSIIMVDVDHFKAYNDAFGHAMGDNCLIKVVIAAQSPLRRPRDFIARYGGEEFMIVLPNTNAQAAKTLGEKIRAAVAALDIARTVTGPGIVTVSVGIATLADFSRSCDVEELSRRADAALYAAKQRGRDRIEVFELGAG